MSVLRYSAKEELRSEDFRQLLGTGHSIPLARWRLPRQRLPSLAVRKKNATLRQPRTRSGGP